MLSVSGPTLVLPVVFIPKDYWDYSHRILASDAKNFDVIPFITYTHSWAQLTNNVASADR